MDSIYNQLLIPETKNYGKIIDERLSKIEFALEEMTTLFKEQNEILKLSIEQTKKLSDRLSMIQEPANN